MKFVVFVRTNHSETVLNVVPGSLLAPLFVDAIDASSIQQHQKKRRWPLQCRVWYITVYVIDQILKMYGSVLYLVSNNIHINVCGLLVSSTIAMPVCVTLTVLLLSANSLVK